jgi:hypothetical protein
LHQGAFTLGVKDFIGPYPHRHRDYYIGSNMLLNLLGSKDFDDTNMQKIILLFMQIVKCFPKT